MREVVQSAREREKENGTERRREFCKCKKTNDKMRERGLETKKYRAVTFYTKRKVKCRKFLVPFAKTAGTRTVNCAR